MAKKFVSEYEEAKFAIENVRLSDGAIVRLMECYGENAAKSVADRANVALPSGYESRVIPV